MVKDHIYRLLLIHLELIYMVKLTYLQSLKQPHEYNNIFPVCELQTTFWPFWSNKKNEIGITERRKMTRGEKYVILMNHKITIVESNDLHDNNRQ